MLEKLLFRSSSKQIRSASQIEEDIRRQLAELERQTTAFHEAIGFLRAMLGLASRQEQEGRSRLLQVSELCEQHTTQTEASPLAEASLSLCQELAIDGWRHDRLYAHTLRQLYHRVLEAKRRFLYQWHQHLMRQVELLPKQRQTPMTALMENSLQGILAVGVGQVEAQYMQELTQMLEHTQAPVAAGGLAEAPTTTIPELLQTLQSMLEQPKLEQPKAHDDT